jgi:hypothetical protein
VTGNAAVTCNALGDFKSLPWHMGPRPCRSRNFFHLAITADKMPLTTMADLGHHNRKRDIVRFFMQNETKERIRCGVLTMLSKSLNQTSIEELTIL